MNFSKLFQAKNRMKPTSQPAPIASPPIPTEENPRRNGIFINQQERSLQIIVYQNDEDSIPRALGSLEMAKDVVKQQMSQWHSRQRGNGILVPSNGKHS
jgi:hypothetical protein